MTHMRHRPQRFERKPYFKSIVQVDTIRSEFRRGRWINGAH